MSRRYSLSKNREFQYVYKRGKVVSNLLLVLIFIKNRHGYNRVGFSISKKFGNAVKRNRTKRQLRELYRANMDNLKTGYDYVFIVRKDAKTADFKGLEGAMQELFKKSRMYV